MCPPRQQRRSAHLAEGRLSAPAGALVPLGQRTPERSSHTATSSVTMARLHQIRRLEALALGSHFGQLIFD